MPDSDTSYLLQKWSGKQFVKESYKESHMTLTGILGFRPRSTAWRTWLMTLVSSARRNDLDLGLYLKDVLMGRWVQRTIVLDSISFSSYHVWSQRLDIAT